VTDYLQKRPGREQYTILANRILNAVEANRTATEARDRQYRLERLLRAIPSCIVQFDRDGRCIYANERTQTVLDIERSDLVGRRYNDSEWKMRNHDRTPIPDDELPFRKVRDSGEPVKGYRLTIQGPDGTERTLLANGVPLSDDGDTVDSVIFSLTDITDRTRAEQRCERIIGRTQDAIVGVDTDWQCTLVNDRAERLYDVSGSDIRGRTVWKVLPWLEDTRFADELRTVMATREPTEFVGKSDELDRWFSMRVYPNDGGGLSFHAVDITDCKRSEHALEREYKSTAGIAELVSEDLQPAVETLRSTLEHLKNRPCTDDTISRIEQAQRRLEKSVDEVLALAPTDEIVSEPVDLNELVRDCWAGIDNRQAYLQTCGDRRIEADPVELRLLVRYVVVGVVEQSGEKVTLTIGVENNGFYVAADPGIPFSGPYGVSEERNSTDGNEIGLITPIVTRIAEAHGWKVAYSTADGGEDRLAFTDVSTVDDEQSPQTSK
jgi:PAS domain S-box-containing protein